MPEELQGLTDEAAEALAALVRVGWDLTNAIGVIRLKAIDDGHPPETADLICQWVLTNLREELEAETQ